MNRIIQLVESRERRVAAKPARTLTERQKHILVAQAFAKEFVRQVQLEMDGKRGCVELGIAQLEAALLNIPPVPRTCSCGHDHFDHVGTLGGACLMCSQCRRFTEASHAKQV